MIPFMHPTVNEDGILVDNVRMRKGRTGQVL